MSNCGCGNKDITPTGCGCATSKKTCKQKSCACPVKDLSTDCIVLGVDLECTQVPKGKILTEALSLIDNFICEKFSSVTNYLTLKNIGGGAKAFKQTNLLGQKEIRTFTSVDESITVSEGAGTIDLSASFCQPRSYKTPLPVVIALNVSGGSDSNVYTLRDSYTHCIEEGCESPFVEIEDKNAYGVKLKYFTSCSDIEGQPILLQDGNTYQAHINAVIVSGDTLNNQYDSIVNYRQVSSTLVDFSLITNTQATFRIGSGVTFNTGVNYGKVLDLYTIGSEVIYNTNEDSYYDDSNRLNTSERIRILNQTGSDITNNNYIFHFENYLSSEVLPSGEIITTTYENRPYTMVLLKGGTTGTATIDIGGFNYAMNFSTDFITTVDNFIATNKTALLNRYVGMTTATLSGGLQKYLIFYTTDGNQGYAPVTLGTISITGDLVVAKTTTHAYRDGVQLYVAPAYNTTSFYKAGFFPLTDYSTINPITKKLPNGNLACVVSRVGNTVFIGGNPATVVDDSGQVIYILDTNYVDTLYKKNISSFTAAGFASDIKIESLSDSSLIFLNRTFYPGNIYNNKLVKLSSDLTTLTSLEANLPVYISDESIPTDIKVLSGDSILIAGIDDTISDTKKLYKINSDGTLFSGFTVPSVNGIYGVNIQSDGKIIVAGSFNGFVKRFSAIGVEDTSFSTNTGITQSTSASDGVVRGITINSSDEIFIYGSFIKVNNQPYLRVFKVKNNGSQDTLNFFKYFTSTREMTPKNPYYQDYFYDINIPDGTTRKEVTILSLETTNNPTDNYLYLKVANSLSAIPKHIAFEISIVETVGSLATYPSS